MATSARTVQTICRYAGRSPENKAKVELWLDEAIQSVADGKGGDVISASSNGASFSKDQAMSTFEWMNTLDEALKLLEAGVKSTGISYGNIC
jgi:hypothetical protein